MCESFSPEIFEVDDNGELLHTDEIPDGAEHEVRQAVDACPTEALSVE